MMNENDINALIDHSAEDYSQFEKYCEKIQYIMDFGEVTVQYDLCMN